VIEGSRCGRFALVAKIHHAAVDGIGGALLMRALLDADRNACLQRSAEAEPSRLLVRDPVRGRRALARRAAAARRASDPAHCRHRRAARVRIAYETGVSAAQRSAHTAQRARNEPARGSAGSVQLSDVKRVKTPTRRRVNHVVLAACAGALRRYLGAHRRDPQQPLVAAFRWRSANDPADGLGNSLSALLVRLPAHLADPLDRLREAPRGEHEAMRTHELLGNQLNEWADLLSPRCSAPRRRSTRVGLAQRAPRS